MDADAERTEEKLAKERKVPSYRVMNRDVSTSFVADVAANSSQSTFSHSSS